MLSDEVYVIVLDVQYWYVRDLVNALDRLLRLRKDNRNVPLLSLSSKPDNEAVRKFARSHDTPIECNVF